MLIFNDIESLTAFRGSRRCAVTIGNFDGCHKGHQALCHELHRYETSSEIIQDPPLTVALTFDPHPALALGHYTHIKRLQTLDDRLHTLGSYGIDVVLKVEFNKEIALLDASSFVTRFLVAGASAAIIAVGQDFKFGRGRSGTVDLLEKMSRDNNYKLNLLQPVKIRGEVASSTLVRRIISELGDFSHVQELLGRPWFFRGTVMHGMKLGRTIGFPTANLDIGDIVLPRAGVYAGWAEVSNRGNLDPSIMPVSLSPHRIPMVMNIGTRPTIDSNEGATKIEAHLLKNEHYELYGAQLKIEPTVLMREEIKFENLDQLKNQIQRDCLQAKYLLG